MAEQKQVQRDKPLSLPVVLMVLGGALAFFPWMGTATVWMKLLMTVIGLGLAAIGFWKSK